jgi:hypothetical protein
MLSWGAPEGGVSALERYEVVHEVATPNNYRASPNDVSTRSTWGIWWAR